ncbi:ferrochelatase [Flavobacterium sp. Sd200]|uniref:ferrochelatase n=1 Tax=Flavobacterium sp. Sd200 TaxID=2692211 RepID=UPI00136F49DA|nr:ferrochelatase [Flavobacterium sp. Sd200]MXN92748.1 ferrochelatase [Flavobacterium sp. Sd200]
MKGVLLVNLGSPDSPTAKDVKPYLDEFLMDKYVIDVPYLLRALLVRGIILRKRPEESAHAYQKIWWPEGSPLIVISKQVHEKVQQQVQVPVALAMRYGKPSIETGLQELADKGVTDVLLFPLYPQYAMASTMTIEVLAEEIRAKKFPNMKMTNVPAFYNNPDYIDALANSIKKGLEGYDYDKLVFSYHGIPERHVRKTDKTKSHKKFVTDVMCCTPGTPAAEFCYRTHCYETTRLVVEKLGLPEDKYYQTFQSRLAGDKWLEPYTDVEIDKMPAQGIKNIAVVTPAFVADCLETLEEIGMRADEDFKANGGQNFKAIPCLNDDVQWIDTLGKWINNWAAIGKVLS